MCLVSRVAQKGNQLPCFVAQFYIIDSLLIIPYNICTQFLTRAPPTAISNQLNYSAGRFTLSRCMNYLQRWYYYSFEFDIKCFNSLRFITWQKRTNISWI